MVDMRSSVDVRSITQANDDLGRCRVGAKVELVEAPGSGHPAHREMWMRVLSNEILDLPSARKLLTPAQAVKLDDFFSDPCAYHPNLGSSSEEREGYAYEEWWAFPVKRWRNDADAH